MVVVSLVLLPSYLFRPFQYVYGGESGIDDEPAYVRVMVAVSYTLLPVFLIPQIFHIISLIWMIFWVSGT